MKKTLQEIAAFVGGRVEVDATIVIQGLDNIEGAGASDLTFAVEPHIEAAKKCQAAAVMLPESVTDFPKPAIYVDEPRAPYGLCSYFFSALVGGWGRVGYFFKCNGS